MADANRTKDTPSTTFFEPHSAIERDNGVVEAMHRTPCVGVLQKIGFFLMLLAAGCTHPGFDWYSYHLAVLVAKPAPPSGRGRTQVCTHMCVFVCTRAAFACAFVGVCVCLFVGEVDVSTRIKGPTLGVHAWLLPAHYREAPTPRVQHTPSRPQKPPTTNGPLAG